MVKGGKVLGALALVAGSIVAVAPAASAADTTPPVLNVPSYPAFQTGVSIGPSGAADDEGAFTGSIPVTLRWDGSDASGICSYKVQNVYHDGGITLRQQSKATSYSANLTDYAGEYGGGVDTNDFWRVTARDCAGNTTVDQASLRPRVIQENGYSATEQPFAEFRLTFQGAWSDSKCTCWSGGAVKKTTAKGATAIFTTYLQRDGHIAVVMAKGPGRGKAQIRVDGLTVATVDTRASTAQNRIVVWQGWFAEGFHTVGVVNMATAGRPRIDVDAFMTLGEWPAATPA